MVPFKLLIFLVATVFQPATTARHKADEFRLLKRRHAIALYERWIRHNGNEVRELKAEFTARTDKAENLVRLLKNESLGLEWNSDARIYEVVEGKEPDAWLLYLQYDIPWPLDDYDCLLAYRYEETPGNGILAEISFKSITSDRFPVSGSVSRITGIQGKWVLEEQAGCLKVTYLLATDRNEKVPRWVADPIVHDNMFKTMTKFRNCLEARNY